MNDYKDKSDTLLELSGTVEHLIYRNESNGYTVLEVSVNGEFGEELVTAVGNIAVLNVGDRIKLIGTFCNHSHFGRQFKVEASERFMPSGTDAILKYLSSGAVKGIGPSISKKIVDRFGDNSLNIMLKDPESLSKIRGISKEKAYSISKQLNSTFSMREVMAYLASFGICPEDAIKIWKYLGDEAIKLINENPYVICDNELELSFDKADQIALKLDKPPYNVDRIKAGIVHILRHNMNNGHTCLPRRKLEPLCAEFLGVDEVITTRTVDELIEQELIYNDVVDADEFLFLPTMYKAEQSCVQRLSVMLTHPSKKIPFAEKEIEKVELSQNINYAFIQKQAIKSAIEKGLLIMTGGPGTGKTTTINAIISILESKGEKVALAAPTGRAAKRMSEVTNREAKTIHRLLGVEWDNNGKQVFHKNEKNLLSCDSLILDELSMVDIVVFEALLRALPLGCRLIMVGDSDQLPSVGPGNVLKDLINTDLFPVVKLNEVFRQSMESLIVTNSHKIINGEYPELKVKNKDFFFLEYSDPEEIADAIVDLVTRRLVKSYGYSPHDIQVLSPGKKGKLGSLDLNTRLQSRINPKEFGKSEVITNNMILREGDKVMQIRNNYDIQWTKNDGTIGEGLFNGDIGTILNIDNKNSAMLVSFDDKNAIYSSDNFNDLELAYAITIHKSQGSEFEAVIIPMFRGARQLYYRNLLYTGVTRAKSLLIMVGFKSTVRYMVDNNRETKRYTGLRSFLRREIKDYEI